MNRAALLLLLASCAGAPEPTTIGPPVPRPTLDAGCDHLTEITSSDCYSAVAALEKCCSQGEPDGGWVVSYDEAPLGACTGLSLDGRHYTPSEVLGVDLVSCTQAECP